MIGLWAVRFCIREKLIAGPQRSDELTLAAYVEACTILGEENFVPKA